MTGTGLLASAFAPLVAVLALVRIDQLAWASWVILGFCAISIGSLTLVLKSATDAKMKEKSVQPEPKMSVSVRHADEQTLSFTSFYVTPIVVALFAPPNSPAFWGTLGLLAIMVIIYVRTGLYHLNPTLALIGYRLYEISTSNGRTFMLLSKNSHLRQKGTVYCTFIGDNSAIETKE